MSTPTPARRDADGLTRAQRIDLMLDLLMICREELRLTQTKTPLTLRQISEFLGVSFQSIQQTEHRAIAKIRAAVMERRAAVAQRGNAVREMVLAGVEE